MMKLLAAASLGLLFFGSPAKTRYHVSFEGSLISLPDSLRYKVVQGDTLDLVEFIRNDMGFAVELDATDDSCHISTHSTSQALTMSSTDCCFHDGKWFLECKGAGELSKPLNFRHVDGYKRILGYDCERFIADGPSPYASSELWVAKDLPKTITPLPVCLFPEGACLEVTMGTMMHIKAVSVEKLED